MCQFLFPNYFYFNETCRIVQSYKDYRTKKHVLENFPKICFIHYLPFSYDFLSQDFYVFYNVFYKSTKYLVRRFTNTKFAKGRSFLLRCISINFIALNILAAL